MADRQKWIIFWSTTLTSFLILCVPGSYGRLLVELNITFPNSNTLLLVIQSNCVGMLATYPILLESHILGFRKTYSIGILISVLGLILMTAHNGIVYELIPTYGLLFGIFANSFISTYMFVTAKMFPYESRYHFFTTSIPFVLLPFSTIIGSLALDFMLKKMTWEYCILVFSASIFISGIFAISTMQVKEYDIDSLVEDRKQDELNTKQTGSSASCVFSLVAVLWAISWLCKFTVASAPIVIMVQYAQSLGIDKTKGTSLVAIAALVEAASRLFASLLGDTLLKGRTLVFIILMMPFIFIANIYGAYCTMYWQLVLYSVFMGIFCGPIIAGMYSVNNEILDGQYVNKLFSVSLTVRGVGLLLGLSGYSVIHEITGSYRWTFYMNAFCSFIVFVICGTLRLFKHRLIRSVNGQ